MAVVFLLNAQIAGRTLRKKLLALQSANEHITNDHAQLMGENKLLKAELHDLIKKDELLAEAARRRDEMGEPSVGGHKIGDLIDKIKLADIMSAKVISLDVNAPFSEVARKMKEYDIRHLPIINEGGNLVGLITQRMLYQIRSPRKLIDGEWYYDEEMLNDIILKNVMEKDITSLSSDECMGKALIKMASTRCGCIPIVDRNNNLIGIVTRKDVLKSLATIYQKL